MWKHQEIAIPFASSETASPEVMAAFKRMIDHEYAKVREVMDKSLYPYGGAREAAVIRLLRFGDDCSFQLEIVNLDPVGSSVVR